ncbi:2-hydroxychromene-2-carboxylate isomerase [Phenylobacterium montanum]|uniref:2-hydroxychromene-2-carboxylate isomerase n=1 Tax=Phenylobacterium montanum TaxID=2823693 RepID=A0A975IUU2_9CAUL|nr:DsbA family protein [Caulobacter sp. S6]QUD88110.1 DsbA family protein [Caulobacter sp. S6]
MTAVVDLFWSFRSPYSYLAAPGALQLGADYDVKVRFRPVLPLAVRQPSFFDPENLKRARYIMIDWGRRAEMLGMPHAWPQPDPIALEPGTVKAAEHQPYIYRLTYLGAEAERRGHGVAFAKEVSALTFGGVVDWHLGDHLARAAERAGLNLAEMDAAIADEATYRAIIEENQVSLTASGHWGVPTFVLDGEPFFGQDRLDTLRWRLDQRGLRRE